MRNATALWLMLLVTTAAARAAPPKKLQKLVEKLLRVHALS